MFEGSDPSVAPPRRSLAIWGHTVDVIAVLSIHRMSSGVNEKTKTAVWNDISGLLACVREL